MTVLCLCYRATYENCGAFVMMEQAVMRMLRKEIGWADGAGDGQVSVVNGGEW